MRDEAGAAPGPTCRPGSRRGRAAADCGSVTARRVSICSASSSTCSGVASPAGQLELGQVERGGGAGARGGRRPTSAAGVLAARREGARGPGSRGRPGPAPRRECRPTGTSSSSSRSRSWIASASGRVSCSTDAGHRRHDDRRRGDGRRGRGAGARPQVGSGTASTTPRSVGIAAAHEGQRVWIGTTQSSAGPGPRLTLRARCLSRPGQAPPAPRRGAPTGRPRSSSSLSAQTERFQAARPRRARARAARRQPAGSVGSGRGPLRRARRGRAARSGARGRRRRPPRARSPATRPRRPSPTSGCRRGRGP